MSGQKHDWKIEGQALIEMGAKMVAVDIVESALAECGQLRADYEALKQRATFFVEAAERAVYEAEHKNDGGMRVPFHGDFASATPSTISRLRWWARDLRSVLK